MGILVFNTSTELKTVQRGAQGYQGIICKSLEQTQDNHFPQNATQELTRYPTLWVH